MEAKQYQKPELVTVFGGSGFIGRYVAEVLTKRGYRVRIAVRNPFKAYYMLQIGSVGQTQMLQADIGNKSDIARALDGASIAVYLPGAFVPQRKNDLQKLHIKGAENVAEAAAEKGINLIHMSCLTAKGGSKSVYAQTKAQGEKRVRSAHHQAIIMRPSFVFGAEDSFFNCFANLARFTPALPLVKGGQAQLQPVYVGDVAEMIALAADGKLSRGKTYELGGREVMTLRALQEKMLYVIRRRRSFVSVPLPFALMWGSWCGIWGKIPLVPTITTADRMRQLCSDSVVSDAARHEKRSLEGAGITPQLMDAVLPSYLWRFRIHGQFSHMLS